VVGAGDDDLVARRLDVLLPPFEMTAPAGDALPSGLRPTG
jgi:hypothetical protein